MVYADVLPRLSFCGVTRMNSDPVSVVYLELSRRISCTSSLSRLIYLGDLGVAVSKERFQSTGNNCKWKIAL